MIAATAAEKIGQVSPSSAAPKLTRLISFRMSEADYQVLLESCKEMKAVTVSQAAREMVSVFLKTGGDLRKLALAGSLRKIEGDMTELRGELRRLKGEW